MSKKRNRNTYANKDTLEEGEEVPKGNSFRSPKSNYKRNQRDPEENKKVIMLKGNKSGWQDKFRAGPVSQAGDQESQTNLGQDPRGSAAEE